MFFICQERLSNYVINEYTCVYATLKSSDIIIDGYIVYPTIYEITFTKNNYINWCCRRHNYTLPCVIYITENSYNSFTYTNSYHHPNNFVHDIWISKKTPMISFSTNKYYKLID